jgi:hypothetical protein
VCFIPLLRVITLLLSVVSLGLCTAEKDAAISYHHYMLMLQLASETVNRTGIMTIYYLVASGWETMRDYFEHFEAGSTAKVLGLAYICHSSYFITIGTTTLHEVAKYCLLTFYAIMLYKSCSNIIKNILTINKNQRFIRRIGLATFEESLALKKRIMVRHLISCVLYMIAVAISVGIHDVVKTRIEKEPLTRPSKLLKEAILKEVFEIALFAWFWWNTRPREWPEYYSISVSDDVDLVAEDEALMNRLRYRINRPLPRLC